MIISFAIRHSCLKNDYKKFLMHICEYPPLFYLSELTYFIYLTLSFDLAAFVISFEAPLWKKKNEIVFFPQKVGIHSDHVIESGREFFAPLLHVGES